MVGDIGASVVVRWRGNGILTVLAAKPLVSEEEAPDNQHEVEGVEWRWRGERYIG